jgi:radical SAM superfamily enzyme YgiQ (UPF0313 family)
LAERCYAPWVDMEASSASAACRCVSLESARPLRDFDVVGFSLQFELTYTNILHDAGPRRHPAPLGARARRDDPLVIAGGPTATHPEPLAPFIDAFVIGDGEEKLPEVALAWARLREAGVPRRERLIALAKLGGSTCPRSTRPRSIPTPACTSSWSPVDPDAPYAVERTFVDLNEYPVPDDSPARGGPEAIFDRMSIEIARGCTEGCRFCQAGMIYRPVRERDPEQIVETVADAP